jgi:hypothetical protein
MNPLFPLALLIIGQAVAFAQPFRNVQLPKPATSSYAYAQVEPSIAIHPKRTRRMIAGTVLNDYYYSTNRGKSWKSSTLTSPYGVNGDPVMHIDRQGRYYYFHLSNPKNGNRLDRIVCSYSDKIKGDWKHSATQPNNAKAQDKHWVAECPLTGTLYLTWTQFDEYKSTHPEDSSRILFAKSIDRGETWSQPKVISTLNGDCLDGNNTVEGAVPAVGADGELYVSWTGPHGIRMNRSADGGETWLEQELFVTDHVGGWTFDVPGIYRCNGLPIIKVDQSGGQHHGRIYINWSDQKNHETDTDIRLIYSDDRGQTWSKPMTVNQDNSGRHQFFTWMDVDPSTGNLYFVYYDRRNYEDLNTDVVMAWSTNGGQSFHERTISETPFIPNETVFFGDYINIAAINGTIRPIWSRMDNTEISLWTALIPRKFM